MSESLTNPGDNRDERHLHAVQTPPEGVPSPSLMFEPGSGLPAGFVPEKAVEPGPEITDEPINQPEQKITGVEKLKRGTVKAPIFPEWMKTPAGRRTVARLAGTTAAHKVAFHTVRSPWHLIRVAWYSVVGLYRLFAQATRFLSDSEARDLRRHAVDLRDVKGYVSLVRERNARVARRSAGLTAAAAAVLVVSVLLWLLAPLWLACAVLAPVLVGLAKYGTPKGKPLISPAVRKFGPPRLTDTTIALAFASIGIGALSKLVKDGKSADLFVSPIERVAHGYRTEIDLPHGVTAAEIAEKRLQLASGLRRQIGAVWPMPMKGRHPGALELWVLDAPFSELPQPAWPLARKGTCDMIGGTIPFGWDQRGHLIRFGLFENNMVIGAAPGQGKTGAVLVIACSGALDPNCEVHYYELKGTGDGSGLRPICHRYVSSAPTPEAIEQIMDGLREVHGYLESRAATVNKVGSARAPESKITPELAADPKLGLYPVLVIIDECQELFQSEQGEEAKQIITTILKRGRALGIELVLSTQNPDSESLPKAADRLVMVRFCLRVNDWQANNMTLGSGAYAAGHRATLFDEEDKGVGLLKTGGTTVRTVRTAWLSRPAVEAIGRRALALREAGGRLTGDAIGQAVPNYADRLTVVQDTIHVFADCPGTAGNSAWLHELEEALSAYRPNLYAGLEAPWLGARLRAVGVVTMEQRKRNIGTTDSGQTNRAGVTLSALRKVLEAPTR